MVTAVYVPRINNNDDEVKILSYDVCVGQKISADQILGQVETDKAVLDVTAPEDGYVIGVVGEPESIVKVGSVMLWLGVTPDEIVPEVNDDEKSVEQHGSTHITAKAKLLLRQYGLKAEAVSPIAGRVTVEAVERYLADRGARVESGQVFRSMPTESAEVMPDIPGKAASLTREEKGMALTVGWHRDHAAAGYIEIEYDQAPWVEYAKRFQDERGLLMPPLLPLMAFRLVEIASQTPRLNATMVGGKRFEYEPVNLGFTIQAGEALYLAVVRNAQSMDSIGFVNALGDVLRRASSHGLKESEASGATIGFSSMERWKVTRHVPILSPHTALMVAHAAGKNGAGVIGATYDHRILNGGQVVSALRKLAAPGND